MPSDAPPTLPAERLTAPPPAAPTEAPRLAAGGLSRRQCIALLGGAASLAGPPGAARGRPAHLPGVAGTLPSEVRRALHQAGIPESAMSVRVQPVDDGPALLSHEDHRPVNPASLMKLVTTYAALDRLGPAWVWNTPLYALGPVRDGVLEGDLVIQGRGDPMLVVERLWLGLSQLRQLGVREIRGDWILDRSAFAAPEAAPGDFDGDASRPYNVQPDALLLNFHAANWTFMPDATRGVALVARDIDGGGGVIEPRSAAGPSRREVPLAGGPCGDWRAALQPEATAHGWRFHGRYPASCGTLSWPLAAQDPEAFGAELLLMLWEQLGGRLRGQVRQISSLSGPSWKPAGTATPAPTLVWSSPPLSEAVRDINKFSNNVMAQQLFLTLARQENPDVPATAAAARAVVRDWVVQRLGEPAPGELVIDNGSGLSRHNRLTARWLARLLQHAWASPLMPAFVSSLPLSGVDGTLRRARFAPGRAHLKTGSLRDVIGLAGYVQGDDEQRRVLVAMIQHPQAQAARPALDALVEWVSQGGPPRRRNR